MLHVLCASTHHCWTTKTAPYFVCLAPTPALSSLAVCQPRRPLPKRSNSSSKKLLERFHVCPLLFREKMTAAGSAVKSKSSAATHPVYRYIFLCPGQAQLLVGAP